MKEYTIERIEIKKPISKLTVKSEYLEDKKCYDIVNNTIMDLTSSSINLKDFGDSDEIKELVTSPKLYNKSTESSTIKIERNTEDTRVIMYITNEETTIFIYKKDYKYDLKKEKEV